MADQSAIDGLVSRLHWLGHDTFRLDTAGGPIYFDPYEIAGGPAAALILVSHDHMDHCAPAVIKKLQGPGTVIITEPASAAKLSGDVRAMAPGQVLEVAGVKVEAVPAYNVDKAFHPKSNAWLGFVVTVDGVRLYHAGDSDHIPEMADLEVDVALLPVSGTYVMTAAQAAQAARDIKPALAIPMHYGAIVGGPDDAHKFAELLKGEIPVRVMTKEA